MAGPDMKLRMLRVEHFVGDTVKGAVIETTDDDRTFQEWLEDAGENQVVQLHYEIDGDGKQHVTVFYAKV